MKDYTIKVTVNNSGLNFEDDVTLVTVYVPEEEDIDSVIEKITEVDKKLHEEDDSGDCEYSRRGYNYTTLMEELELIYNWKWQVVSQDINFTIN